MAYIKLTCRRITIFETCFRWQVMRNYRQRTMREKNFKSVSEIPCRWSWRIVQRQRWRTSTMITNTYYYYHL